MFFFPYRLTDVCNGSLACLQLWRWHLSYILRRKINVLWSSGLFVMNSNGKSLYLSIYFQSVWFPAVHHLSTRCTTRPNFSPYPEIASFMVGQRLLHEDAGGRWASIAARLGGAFCPYKSTNSTKKNRWNNFLHGLHISYPTACLSY